MYFLAALGLAGALAVYIVATSFTYLGEFSHRSALETDRKGAIGVPGHTAGDSVDLDLEPRFAPEKDNGVGCPNYHASTLGGYWSVFGTPSRLFQLSRPGEQLNQSCPLSSSTIHVCDSHQGYGLHFTWSGVCRIKVLSLLIL